MSNPKSPFKKGSRAYKMAFPSERALKRRANMPGVKALSGIFLAVATIQINQSRTINN